MNFKQKFLASVFGFQYVILVFYDGSFHLRRAYELGGEIYANPYLPKTRVLLMPGGETKGQSFVARWKPVTHKTQELFNQSQQGDQQ